MEAIRKKQILLVREAARQFNLNPPPTTTTLQRGLAGTINLSNTRANGYKLSDLEE